MKRLIKAVVNQVVSLTQTKEERRHALVGAPEFWKMKRDFQIRFMRDVGLNPNHYLFEIGCGTLRGGLPIIEFLQDGHYFGADVREEVLAEARKELIEAGLESKSPTLLSSPDISRLTVDWKFDYIWAFSVLIHMSDAILDAALAFVSSHLADEGVFYANVNVGDRKDGVWLGFPVVTRAFDFYSRACARNDLVVIDIGSLKQVGHNSGDESQDNQRMLKVTKR